MTRSPNGPTSRSGAHRRPPRRGFTAGLVLMVAVAVAVVAWRADAVGGLFGLRKTAARAGGTKPAPGPTVTPSPPTSPLPTSAPSGASSATPGPINTAFPGLTTFRGNATRSYYGEGPVPTHPVVLWRHPRTGSLCSTSVDGQGARVWCGTGWTGQPNVIQHDDGTIEVREGAYDGRYHFLNGRTGAPMRPDLVTGDLAKGSATSDADGYPLYYAGSRDNFLRVVALDRSNPTVLWSVDANTSVPDPVWNNDWDGAPLQVGDYLLEGGENSWFYVIRLHRRYDRKGLVQVRPKIVMLVPGWDDQLLRDLGDHDVSIENSVAFDASRGVVYFANSGGLVQGWDISNILAGGKRYRRVFRFWNGDETDASVVIDQRGFLYVGRHASFNVPSRPQVRDHEVGSLMKLDPRRPKHPVVWSVQLGGFEPDGGILGTPALYHGVVYATFTEGGFAAVDQATGKVYYEVRLPGPTWNSPVPVDDQLLVGDCSGVLHSFDISDRTESPRERWRVELSGCLESTPAVWHGMIYVGTRGGGIYGIGDPRG